MMLSLAQAATLLGKSPRQVRYMIKSGQLAASKVDNCWAIDEAALPLTAAQRSALETRAAAARDAFERALAPAEAATQRSRERYYSVTRLEAFSRGEALYREARILLGDDPACTLLFSALEHVTRGCHTYRPGDKARCFSEARTTASKALTHLLLGEGDIDGRRGLAERLEAEVLPRISGLLAACERRSRRRPEHFGALQQTLAEGRR